jgi:hypothetical protein
MSEAVDAAPRWWEYRRLLLFWALVHSGVVTCFCLDFSASGLMVKLPDLVRFPTKLYGAVTGATGAYGFFSPNVGAQLKARFEITTATEQHKEVFLWGSNREMSLRIGNITDSQWNVAPGEEALANNRALASSLGGKVLAHYPEASAVTVIVEYFDVPRMGAFQAGTRPTWKPFYRATLKRSGAP